MEAGKGGGRWWTRGGIWLRHRVSGAVSHCVGHQNAAHEGAALHSPLHTASGLWPTAEWTMIEFCICDFCTRQVNLSPSTSQSPKLISLVEKKKAGISIIVGLGCVWWWWNECEYGYSRCLIARLIWRAYKRQNPVAIGSAVTSNQKPTKRRTGSQNRYSMRSCLT